VKYVEGHKSNGEGSVDRQQSWGVRGEVLPPSQATGLNKSCHGDGDGRANHFQIFFIPGGSSMPTRPSAFLKSTITSTAAFGSSTTVKTSVSSGEM